MSREKIRELTDLEIDIIRPWLSRMEQLRYELQNINSRISSCKSTLSSLIAMANGQFDDDVKLDQETMTLYRTIEDESED